MMDGVSMSLDQGDGKVSVTGSLVFFEYQQSPQAAK